MMWLYHKNFLLPVDTGRKLNVHKTFRRPPGRSENLQDILYSRAGYTSIDENIHNYYSTLAGTFF